MTEREKDGIAWWNSLTKPERLFWLAKAGGDPSPSDAYTAYLVR